MKIKNYFFSFFLLFSLLFSAQQIQLGSSPNTISEWESIIRQQDSRTGDIISAKHFLQPLLSRNSNTDKILCDVLLAKSYAQDSDRVNENSDHLYSQSILNAKKLKNESLEIWAILSYAEYLYHFRQITKALPLYISAIDKIEQAGSKQILFPSASFTIIGFYMGTIGDNNEAIKYLKKALQFTEPESKQFAKVSDNIGMYYLKIGDIKNSKINIEKASKVAKALGDDIRYAKTLGNLAQIYERKRDYQTAIKLLLQDIQISEVNDGRQNTMYAYTVLTRIYIADGQIDKANESAEKADEIAKSRSYFKINELEILKLKLEIINKEQKDDDELGVRRRIGILEDSLNRTDGILPLNQANWMMQKKRYQQNMAATNQKLSREAFWRNIIFGGAGLLILVMVIIFLRSKHKEKKKQIENERMLLEYEDANFEIEEQLLNATRAMDSQISFLKEKNIQIQKLYREIENVKETKSNPAEEEHGKLDDLLQSHLMTEENWLNFRREFQKEYPDFYQTLKETFPEITDSNLRIILLQKLKFTNMEISGLLGITIDAVKKSKQRLKRKLGERYEVLFSMLRTEK